MGFLLEALRGYPVSTDVQEQLRATPEWEQARGVGLDHAHRGTDWNGHRHAVEQPRGIIR